MIKIELSWHNVMMAALTGVCRNIKATQRGRQHAYGMDGAQRGWQSHCEGAIGEAVVAKWKGVYWDGSVGFLDTLTGDVGGYQVRTTGWRNGCLLLHPLELDDEGNRAHGDRDDDIFILVLSHAMPVFTIRGWIRGIDGKQVQWWTEKNDNGRPCFFVPQAALEPIEELPSL